MDKLFVIFNPAARGEKSRRVRRFLETKIGLSVTLAPTQSAGDAKLLAARAVAEGWRVVVAAGGGGVPVIADENGILSGVPAVIDKDLASAVLAREIRADLLVISTSVERVFLNFGQPGQRALSSMTVAEARQYTTEGHFKPGSMLPKIEACLQFIENGGREAVITCPAALSKALDGQTGTRIVP